MSADGNGGIEYSERRPAHGKVAKLVAVLVFLVAACSSSGSGLSGIAEYADGRWLCDFTTAIGPDTPIVEFAATVSARSATSGRVHLAVVVPKGFTGPRPPKQSGEWSLRDGRLAVQWTSTSLGPTTAAPISMETERFRIRGDATTPFRRGQWVTVNVDFGARTATFDFTTPADHVRGTLTCHKR